MKCGVHCEQLHSTLQQNVAREGISVRTSVSNGDSPRAISQELPAPPEILMNSPPGQLQKWPLLAIFRTPMTIFSQFMTTAGCKLGTRFGSFSPTNRSGYVSHNVCTFVLYSWKRERGNLAPLDNKLVMRHSGTLAWCTFLLPRGGNYKARAITISQQELGLIQFRSQLIALNTCLVPS